LPRGRELGAHGRVVIVLLRTVHRALSVGHRGAGARQLGVGILDLAARDGAVGEQRTEAIDVALGVGARAWASASRACALR